ncbi:Rgp1-domain-containing protein [Delitschia confertaspora ATCC 74209]|uniref:Rgp1-domain-containing protein n=1 Tax=Delitschia confertaspora ATCC 74209 TaxID=1513339 RepID=A0A9P4JPD3_9PLEO|nr:Rgp1-domain-containing protein [Delitschia confertaspora ATCC 74209]
MSSNIRVFVQWKESTVFAGENIECTITFKNVAPPSGADRSAARSSKQNGHSVGGDRYRKLNPIQSSTTRPSISRNSSFASQITPHLRGHKPALSLSTPSVTPGRSPLQGNGASNNGSTIPRYKHGRSLSIISMGTDAAAEVSHDRAPSRRPARGHGRSASLQVIPGRPSPFSAASFRSATHHSPLAGSSSPPIIHEPTNEFPLPTRPSRRAPGVSTAPNTPVIPGRKPSNSFSQNFKFPAAPSPNLASEPPNNFDVSSSPRVRTPQLHGNSPRPPEEPPPNAYVDGLSPIARILSGSSMNGTPRSSGEFYSMSNHSSETLASEYVSQSSTRLLPRAFQYGRTPQINNFSLQKSPETLMMGYAQIMGSFTLDGSLINQAPFEEVKRKGVVGGQGGGGVVGVERTKRDSGLFGALGWGNIGESLGGLLGSSEPSSIREMRGIASSKDVPLITTPQSILFVDLRLAPGESKSYSYSFTLPRGLPPTHKGRSIKVAYHLTIGIQRPGSAKDQQMRHVDVPFRVFGSVNSRGDILGHDLMSPYIMLRDQARTACLDPHINTANGSPNKRHPPSSEQNDPAFNDFLDYVNNLLNRPRQDSNMGLLSPTETIPGRRSIGGIEAPQTMKESIDLAILRSNITSASNQSANRFEIARSGRRVAVIMLARPAYRLGETIYAVVDFSNADIPCYSIHISLETAEKVDPAIALRSNASIYRVTRKVHASFSENALFARRLTFAPTIPPTSTPEFITSGVSLEWKLRVEFITPRLMHENGEEAVWDDLLEEVSGDDRGIVLAAAERLPSESFEVNVPVKVYGAVNGGVEKRDEEGLVV